MCFPFVNHCEAFGWARRAVLSSISHVWGSRSLPRTAATRVLALLIVSHLLLHTPRSLLLWEVRNSSVLRITSASLQFGHRSLYSHPSLSLCSLSEGVHSPFQRRISFNQDPELNLRTYFSICDAKSGLCILVPNQTSETEFWVK